MNERGEAKNPSERPRSVVKKRPGRGGEESQLENEANYTGDRDRRST